MNEYGSLLIGFGFAAAAFVSSLIHIRYEKAKRVRSSPAYNYEGASSVGGAGGERQATVREEWRVGGANSRTAEGSTGITRKSEADAKRVPTKP